MRLVCPKCAAQYEVDDSAIPDAGRNVQCGDTWFQEPLRKQRPEPEYDADDDIDFTAADGDEDEDRDAASPPASEPGRRRSDPSVLEILRSEAERENAARNAERSGNGSTGDEPPADARDATDLASRARAARMRAQGGGARERRGEAPDTPRERPHEAPAPRRPARQAEDSLPDVDELNSSLRSADDRSRRRDRKKARARGETGERRRPVGRRLGFYFACLLALLMAAAYALEGQLAAAVPEAAPYLARYVVIVDTGRRILDAGFETIVVAVRRLMEQYL